MGRVFVASTVVVGLLSPAPTAGQEDPPTRQDASRLARQVLDDRTWFARAVVVRVAEGSTIIVDVDLGWMTWRRGEAVRLSAVSLPEPADRDRREAARSFLETLLRRGTEVLLIAEERSASDGPTRARVILRDGRDIGAELIKVGLAAAAAPDD